MKGKAMMFDSHVHSKFSPDADQSADISNIAVCAKEIGLSYVTVTDHCDCNFFLPEGEFDYPEYQKQDSMMFGARDYATASIKKCAELKDRYPELLCGVELGQPLQNPQASDIITSMKELDFIIGSLHMNDNKPDFYWIEYKKIDISVIRALLDSYFDEILQMAASADFDVLGHLTYPLRYIEGECGLNIDMLRYDEIIRDIFRTLIENGRGIEINTSGCRQKFGRPFPDEEYLKLYRSLGGEIITVGSDAHKTEDIGAGVDWGEQLLRHCGFKYVTLFKERKPHQFRL